MRHGHGHYLIQSTPNHSPGEIIRVEKNITTRRIFAEHPEVKAMLWGGIFLDVRVFRRHCGQAYWREHDKGLCEEGRGRKRNTDSCI